MARKCLQNRYCIRGSTAVTLPAVMNESAGRVEGSDGNAIPDPAEVLEVSEACDAAAVIVAEVICRRCDLPFSQVIQVASRELFDAARMVADLAMREVGQTIQPEGG